MRLIRTMLGALTVGLALIAAALPVNASAQDNNSLSPTHYIIFTNHLTLACLDNNGSSAYSLYCYKNANQRWITDLDGSLRSQGTDMCLDSNFEGQVYVLPCNGGGFQRWRYLINDTLVNSATGLCLDTNQSYRVYTLGCNGGGYQRWSTENWWE